MSFLERLKEEVKLTEKEYKYFFSYFSKTDDINAISRNGQTMLTAAVRDSKIDLVKKLIMAGADVNVPTRSGDFPLHLADEPDIVKILIENDANVDAINNYGCTPICCIDNKESADLLIKKNCNLNLIFHCNDQIHTPLSYAIQARYPNEDLISSMLNGYKYTPITKEVFTITLKNFLKYPNSTQVFKFLLSNNDLYKQVVNEYTPEEQAKLRQIEQIIDKPTNPNDPNFFLNLFSRLNDPIGCYSYKEALLTMQAIHVKKQASYDFNPTFVLNDRHYNQLEDYLNCIKTAHRPLRERFVFGTSEELAFEAVHWVSGDILINDAGEVSVILFDSLNKLSNNSNVKYVEQVVKAIFPQSSIYIEKIQRQNDRGSICFAFALDDVRHSYTAHRYLSKAYSNSDTGLFEYVKDHDGNLPLLFMRTLQSKSFYEDDSFTNQYTAEEKDRHLGKDKKSWKQLKDAYEKNSGFVNKDTPHERTKNLRIREKLSAMCELSIEYLINNIASSQHFEEVTKKFTIDGFKDRMVSTSHQQQIKNGLQRRY